MLLHGKTILTHKETKAIFPSWRVTKTFNYFLLTASLQSSRYTPQKFGFACQNPLRTAPDGKYQNPLNFVPADEASEIFGIDFGGASIEVMIGELCNTLLGDTEYFIPAASYTQALTMSDVLLRVACTNDRPGKSEGYARVLGAQLFESRTNNHGHGGVDYWILGFDRAKVSPEQLQKFRINCAQKAFPDFSDGMAPSDAIIHLLPSLRALAALCEQRNHIQP